MSIGYDLVMRAPKFSRKQLFLSAAWVGFGLVCLAFSTSPDKAFELQSADPIAQEYRVAAWVVGFACVFAGIIILITPRRGIAF